MMLQQTQTTRVSSKYKDFLQSFPDFQSLAEASLENVLEMWQGLGYNRRAKALKEIATQVIENYNGNLPRSKEALKKFPQIGEATSSSIMAFAFNEPIAFIETNIRRVYLYFFFPGKNNVSDEEILPYVSKTLDKKNPREWYYALMDYGVMLKKRFPRLNKRSKHYRKQKPFKGSRRQIRGKILKLVLKNSSLRISEVYNDLNFSKERIDQVLNQLEKEGFIELKNGTISVS
jgi:A/G-specific adenine glycosylase